MKQSIGKDKGRDSASFFAEQLANDLPTIMAYERGAKTTAKIARALGNARYMGDYWLWNRPLLTMEMRVSSCRDQRRSSSEDLVDRIDMANSALLPVL